MKIIQWAVLSKGKTMDKMPVFAVVFYSIPEAIVLLALGLTLMGVPLRWGRIMVIAIILSMISYFSRELPLAYGFHTVIYLISYIFLVMAFFRVPLQVSSTAGLVGLLLLLAVETAYLPLVVWLTGKSIQEIWPETFMRVLIPMPELLVLVLITWWCRKKKVTFSSTWPFQKMHNNGEKSRQEKYLP